MGETSELAKMCCEMSKRTVAFVLYRSEMLGKYFPNGYTKKYEDAQMWYSGDGNTWNTFEELEAKHKDRGAE